jgi:hypothetical protein
MIEPAYARLRIGGPEPVLSDQGKEDRCPFDALAQMRFPRFAALDAQVVDENLPGFELSLQRSRESRRSRSGVGCSIIDKRRGSRIGLPLPPIADEKSRTLVNKMAAASPLWERTLWRVKRKGDRSGPGSQTRAFSGCADRGSTLIYAPCWLRRLAKMHGHRSSNSRLTLARPGA